MTEEPKRSTDFQNRIEQLRQAGATLDREELAAQLTDQVSAVAAAQVAIQAMIGELEISLRLAIREESQPAEPRTRIEWRKCGNQGCHCRNGGALHGPYEYAYWWDKEAKQTRKKLVRKVEAEEAEL